MILSKFSKIFKYFYRITTPRKLNSNEYVNNIISPFKEFVIKPNIDSPFKPTNCNIASPVNFRFYSPMNSK